MEDTYSYRGWFVSDLFWKRALAVFGYGLVVQVIIVVAMGLFIIILAMIAAFVFGMASAI